MSKFPPFYSSVISAHLLASSVRVFSENINRYLEGWVEMSKTKILLVDGDKALVKELQTFYGIVFAIKYIDNLTIHHERR